MCPNSYIFLPPYITPEIRAVMANFILSVSLVIGNVGCRFKNHVLRSYRSYRFESNVALVFSVTFYLLYVLL
jgi:hypothetical protein